jgi:hypothetical protein
MAVLASDNFNRANSSDLGTSWDVIPTLAACQVASNVAALSTTSIDCAESYNGVTWPDDQYSQLTLPTLGSGSDGGPCARVSISAATFYIADTTSSNMRLMRVISGSWTELTAFGSGATAGDIIRIEVQSTTLKYFQNGTQRLSTTDSNITSGRAGLLLYAVDDPAAITGDNWEGGSLGTSQSHARWGVDDGTESAHSWEAVEDTNITIAANQARLLRLQVDTGGDTSATAYTLRHQKNGTGGYTVTPVGSSTVTSPPAAPTATVTTIGTATTPWTINRPSAATGDMVVFVLCWDDSTTVTSVTAPAGPNSESAVSIAGPVASASTEIRAQAWYYLATAAWSSGTLTFTPSASETVRAVAFVIPTGQYNASDPIGLAETRASAGTAETSILSPTGTAEADDGSGRWYIAFCSDVDAITAPGADWNTINNATGGGVGLCVGSRNTLLTNSESVAALTATIAGDSWCSLGFAVKAFTTTNEIYISSSANIVAGGEDTTARLSPPSSKTTTDFVTGRRWDDENGTDTTDITTDDYSEFEWPVFLASSLTNGDYVDFRLYAGSNAFSSYTITPRWTVGTGGGGSGKRHTLMLLGVG